MMPTISKQEAIKRGLLTSGLQTILIPHSFGTLTQMKAWLKKHSYKYGTHRKTVNFTRFIQNLPIKNATYYSKVLSNGIELVFMHS